MCQLDRATPGTRRNSVTHALGRRSAVESRAFPLLNRPDVLIQGGRKLRRVPFATRASGTIVRDVWIGPVHTLAQAYSAPTMVGKPARACRVLAIVRMRATSSPLIGHKGATTARGLERWATLATAAAIIGYGLTRRTVSGTCIAVAATPLAYRGLAGSWPSVTNGRGAHGDTRAALGGRRGIHVRESIRLEKPLEEVYRFWRQLENLPRFMTHLERVTELDDRRSHWVARGPADMRVEWDAEIINEVPNKVLGWRSLPGSDVVSAGSVNFSLVRGGRSTQVSVHLQYAPPTGRAGALLASLFGREPSQTIREDLRHLKQILEAGEIPQAVPKRSRKRG
jgi:uncharacterized membrane protein